MKINNRIANMMLTNAAIGATLSVEEAKLISHYLNGSKKN